tara:strand:+ start:983 stop:1117 length:135 start_codon:yes stop_codon:yes gene_type:complete
MLTGQRNNNRLDTQTKHHPWLYQKRAIKREKGTQGRPLHGDGVK